MKKKMKVVFSIILTLALVIGNLGSVSKVHASEDVDLTTLETISWGDFSIEEEAVLRLDVSASSTNSDYTKTTLLFYSNAATGSLGDESLAVEKVEVPTTGETVTIEMSLEKFLIDGAFEGFTFALFEGPAWDSGDGIGVNIEKVSLVTDEEKVVDVSSATWSHPTDDLTGGNNFGSWSYDNKWTMNGAVIFAVQRMTLASPVAPGEEALLQLKVSATSTDTAATQTTLLFFNNKTTGSFAENAKGLACAQEVVPVTGEAITLQIPLKSFLVDGAFEGFTFAIYEGPAWDSGNTMSVSFEEVSIVTEEEEIVDISGAAWSQPTSELAGTNNWGSWSYGTAWTVSGSVLFSTHRMTLPSPIVPGGAAVVQLKLSATSTDTTLSQAKVLLFNNATTGDVASNSDELACAQSNIPTTGEAVSVKVPLENLLVDGKFPGFTFALFSGPAWDSGNTVSLNVEEIAIVIEDEQVIDISGASWSQPTSELTGMNNWGSWSYSDKWTGSGMIIFSLHRMTLPAPVDPYEEPETPLTLNMDVTVSTNDGTTDSIKVNFFNNSFTGRIDDTPTAERNIKADGSKTALSFPLEDFLVDGTLPGFMFSVLGGPAWDSATGDRSNIKIENVRIEGGFVKAIDMSTASWVSGGSTGLEAANAWGSISYAEEATTISGMIFSEAHKVSFASPVTAEEEFELYMDVALSTNDGTTESINVSFYNNAFTGRIDDTPTASRTLPADGSVTEVVFPLNDFLVDGAFPGFAFGILGGPAHDSATGDRSTIRIENVRIVGSFVQKVDMSVATWLNGGETGLEASNSWGSISYANGATTVSGMIFTEAHEATFATPIVPAKTENTYALQEGDINNTIFNGDIVLKEDGTFYYGGYNGLAIALNEDGTLSVGSEKCNAADYGLDTFAETQFNLKIATIAGETASVGVWINNVKVGENYISVEEVANEIVYDSTLVIPYATSINLLPGIVNLEDLYYDLADGTYTVPSELVAAQSKTLDGNVFAWTDRADILGADELNSSDDYKLQYYENNAEYVREVILFNSDDVSLKDYMRTLKQVDDKSDREYKKCELRLCDADANGSIDETDIELIQNKLIGK